MIRWCRFCSKYLGEMPPLSYYSLSFTVCEKCEKNLNKNETALLNKQQEKSEFYSQIRANAKNGSLENADALLNRAASLGIAPIDLVIGMIQPVLYEIGESWSIGELSIADEHYFSTYTESIFTLIYSRNPELNKYRFSRSPKVLLTVAADNYHVIGIRLVELITVSLKIPVYTVLPGLPASEIFNLIKNLNPEIVGISISFSTQLQSVLKLSEMVKRLPEDKRPEIVLGGYPVRNGLTVPKETGISTCADLLEIRKRFENGCK